MTLQGIDVSQAGQGVFNWNAYRGKVSFAFCKITEGTTFADPMASRNVEWMRSLGITPGGYHFLHAGQPGGLQAEWFLARAAGLLNAGCLIGLDAEDEGLDGLSPAHMNETAADFCAELRKHHDMWPELYTEISLAPAMTSMGNCPLWLANPSGMTVKAVGPWKQVSFEQTGQRGVDCDVFYGDAAALAKLAIPK